MVTKLTVPEGQGAPPAVELANALAPSPDAAAQAALTKAAEVQSARVSLAAQAAPKPAVPTAPVNSPTAPSIFTPPVVPAGTPPEIAEEPGFLDGLSKYFTKAKAEGKSTIGATFGTLVHAIGNGIDKLSDWFGLKKRGKKVAAVTPPAAPASDPQVAVENEPVEITFDQNMLDLMQEFGITPRENPKENFFSVAVELGKEVEAKYGIPYRVVAAQACLESGFGTSGLTRKGLNCFGYKQGSKDVPYVTMNTKEFEGGRYVTIPAKFRTYASLRESFMDYGRLLTGSSRYKEAFQYKDSPRRFLEEVIKGGYATDPNYVSKADKLMGSYGLPLYSLSEHVS